MLVAVSHGYQLKNTVGSQELRQVLHFQQETVNFFSPSGKKFHRINIEFKVPYSQWGPNTHEDPHETGAARKAAQPLFGQKNHF